jgi:hypothetical protein
LDLIFQKFKLLFHFLLDPSHIWLRKYIEWLFETFVKSPLLLPNDARLAIREVSLELLDSCLHDENLMSCPIDRCFEWIYTFQWMYQFDKEISWLDDAEWISEQGCWNSSIWPAGQDLGDGSLLKLVHAMEPLLRRCATALDEQEKSSQEEGEELNEEKSRGATELMRFAECAGECMRVLSAILKPRRGAVISPLSPSDDPEKDQWNIISNSIMFHGCKLLSSDLVSKVTLSSLFF